MDPGPEIQMGGTKDGDAGHLTASPPGLDYSPASPAPPTPTGHHVELDMLSEDAIGLLGAPRQPQQIPPQLPDLPPPQMAPCPAEILEALTKPGDGPLAIPANATPELVAACNEAVKGEQKGKGKGSSRHTVYDDNEVKKSAEAPEAAEAAADAAEFADTPVPDGTVLHL